MAERGCRRVQMERSGTQTSLSLRVRAQRIHSYGPGGQFPAQCVRPARYARQSLGMVPGLVRRELLCPLLHGPHDDPQGPATGTYRVMRGGVDDTPIYQRSASRLDHSPSFCCPRAGFRIVCEV